MITTCKILSRFDFYCSVSSIFVGQCTEHMYMQGMSSINFVSKCLTYGSQGACDLTTTVNADVPDLGLYEILL
jgi:hypothetical protein